jgi:hypothetical protein
MTHKKFADQVLRPDASLAQERCFASAIDAVPGRQSVIGRRKEVLQNFSAQPQGIDPPAKVGCRISEGTDARFRFPDRLSSRFSIRRALRPDASQKHRR